MPPQETWKERLYALYEEGRKKGAPQSYIDYFKVRELLLKEIDTARTEERAWILCKDEMPPLNRPVLCAIQFCNSKKIVYNVLKKVQSDDHDWEIADDESELSYDVDVLA